jgi:HD superfamily phosphohydrolase
MCRPRGRCGSSCKEFPSIYHDDIYGPAEIAEPALLEPLDSTALQRLRGIYQGGITALLGITPDFSRFDPAAGVAVRPAFVQTE